MNRFTKFAAAAALIAGAAAIAAPASAATINVAFGFGGGFAQSRNVVCNPYSRFYDPFFCMRHYRGPSHFRWNGSWGGGNDRDHFRPDGRNDRNDRDDRGGWNGSNNNNYGNNNNYSNNNNYGNHGGSGGRNR